MTARRRVPSLPSSEKLGRRRLGAAPRALQRAALGSRVAWQSSAEAVLSVTSPEPAA